MGAVGEREELGEVEDRAHALLPADHPEVPLVAVQVGEEDDPGLVVEGGRPEDVAGELDRRLEGLPVAVGVAGVERLERRRGGRRDGVEDAEQGIAVALVVARDQAREVEVVARVHADAGGEAAPHLDLTPLVEE